MIANRVEHRAHIKRRHVQIDNDGIWPMPRHVCHGIALPGNIPNAVLRLKCINDDFTFIAIIANDKRSTQHGYRFLMKKRNSSVVLDSWSSSQSLFLTRVRMFRIEPS